MSDFDDDDPRDEDRPRGRSGSGRGDGGQRPAQDDDWDDDWDDDDEAGGGRRDLTLIFAIIAAVAVIALVIVLTQKSSDKNDSTAGGSTTPGQTQDSGGGTPPTGGGFCDQWPGAVGGNKATAVKADGVRIWSDFDGWHVRANRKDVTTIKLASPGTIKVKDKGNATATPDGKDVALTIPAGDGSAGPDLDLDCTVSSITFTIQGGASSLPAGQIQVGDTGSADNNPVTFRRGDA